MGRYFIVRVHVNAGLNQGIVEIRGRRCDSLRLAINLHREGDGLARLGERGGVHHLRIACIRLRFVLREQRVCGYRTGCSEKGYRCDHGRGAKAGVLLASNTLHVIRGDKALGIGLQFWGKRGSNECRSLGKDGNLRRFRSLICLALGTRGESFNINVLVGRILAFRHQCCTTWSDVPRALQFHMRGF